MCRGEVGVGDHGEVTVENLLTMAGGVEIPQPEWAYEWEPGDGRSFVGAALERPSVAAPGTEFTYSTGMTHVLGAVLAEATGESLCDYAARRLFGPLGIDVERWHVDLDGYFGGLFLTPREVARFGQLVLDNGVFDGERLVSSSWLEASLSTHWDLGCIANPAVAERYGYLWWGYEIGGHDVWMASGFGAQDLASRAPGLASGALALDRAACQDVTIPPSKTSEGLDGSVQCGG